jgi:hypothetical protein
MSNLAPFNPHYGTNQVVTPAAASASVVVGAGNKQLRILNTGSNIGYFKTFISANGSVSATTADCPVGPNMATTVTKFEDHDSVAYISAAGTTFQIMTGEGW